MKVVPSVVDAIGDTPLIRLNRASAATGCEIWGKAEFLNPGQSVKDRAALFMVRDAEARGTLRPGGRIVEGTAGNTGIGLAMVAKALGYSCTIVIPRTQSQEKKDALKLYGAELVEVDAVPYANAGNYVKVSSRLATELDEKEPNGAAWGSIRPLGFDERFRKLWKFYLSYCEAGFRTERTSVVQLSLAKA